VKLFRTLTTVFLLLFMLAANTVSAAGSETKIDAVLAVDVSTSMNNSDRNKISYEAMKMFIDMASVQGDKIGVVAYTDQILREKALLKIQSPQDKDDLKGFINQLVRGPYTDIAVGVTEAVKVLESGMEQGHVPLIVLLTDGNNSLPSGRTQADSDSMLQQSVKKAVEKGIPVYTIGLNADGQLNKGVLEGISKETKGKSFVTSTADNLPQILSEIYADHLKLKVIPLQTLVGNGEFQDVTVSVPNASVMEANISIMSPNPVELKLFNPGGQGQAVPSDSIVRSVSNAYTLLKIVGPEQGDWKLQVKGINQDRIDINLVYNYDLKLTLEPLPAQALKVGDSVAVKAYLESNGQPITDPELYKDLKATLIVTDTDAKKTEQTPIPINGQTIQTDFKIPEPHNYEIKVKVEGPNFLRETDPALVQVAAPAASPTPAPAPAPASAPEPAKSSISWPLIAAGIVVLLALILGAMYAMVLWKRANRGFVGQMVVEIRDENTGERTTPQYRKLNAFKGKFSLHQLLQLAPEFSETDKLVFRPGPEDNITLINQSSCQIEKGGRVFDATKGKELRSNDKIKITMQNVNKSITLEYLK
jgi:Ca-activated chloride channel homolog